MSAQPTEALPRIRRLDPASPEGRAAAQKSAVLSAAVIARLRREGRPIPGDST